MRGFDKLLSRREAAEAGGIASKGLDTTNFDAVRATGAYLQECNFQFMARPGLERMALGKPAAFVRHLVKR
jgi:hypothetical protein